MNDSMCCSIRAIVFFFASLHLYFAIEQLIGIIPSVIVSFSTRGLEAVLAFFFGVLYFSSGFMTYRGADEESSTLIGIGGIILFLITAERFLLMYFNLLLSPILPEGDFLVGYHTFTGTGPMRLPVAFALTLYALYLATLFAYYSQLKQEEGEDSDGEDGGESGDSCSLSLYGIAAPPPGPVGSSGIGDKEKLNIELESPRYFPGAPIAPAGSGSSSYYAPLTFGNEDEDDEGLRGAVTEERIVLNNGTTIKQLYIDT